MQLRAAANVGPVDRDDYGFVGDGINLVFRMLDARPLERALADSGAELALIVSDYVYTNLADEPELRPPSSLRVRRGSIRIGCSSA
jgi:hypothetical protein